MRALLSLALLATASLPFPAASGAAEGATQVSWGAPGDLTVSPDGSHVYATGRMRTIAFRRDRATGKLEIVQTGLPGGEFVALRPDGRFVYVADDRRIHTLRRDTDSGELTYVGTVMEEPDGQAELSGISGLAVSPDGRNLYVAARDADALTIFRLAATGTLELQGVLMGGPGFTPGLRDPSRPQISADGAFVYVGGSEGTALLARRADTGALTSTGVASQAGGPGVLAPDGARYYADNDSFQRATESGELSYLGSCHCWGEPTVSPDSRTVYRAEWGGDFTQAPVTPTGIGAPTRTYTDVAGRVEAMAFSPDGKHAYVSGGTGPASGSDEARTRPFGEGSVTAFRMGASNELKLLANYKPTYLTYPPWGAATASIEDGAIYTRSLAVTVRVTCPSNPVGLRLANDPAMTGATAMPLSDSGEYRWTLPDNAGLRDVKHVYARCVYLKGYSAQDGADDIILDQRAPELSGAVLRGRVLRVRASDNRSRVVSLRLRSPGARRGVAIRYGRRVELPRRFRRLWVRAVDGAGNASAWRKVTARR